MIFIIGTVVLLNHNQTICSILYLYFWTECDSCTNALLDDLEGMDDELAWLKQQFQNISHGAVSLTTFNMLEAAITNTKVSMHAGISAIKM